MALNLIIVEPAGEYGDSSNGPLVEGLIARGHTVVYHAKRRSKLAYFLCVMKSVWLETCDVLQVHSYSGNFPNELLLWIAKWRRIGALLVVHDVSQIDSKGRGHGVARLRQECKHASMVAVLSPGAKNELQEKMGIYATELRLMTPFPRSTTERHDRDSLRRKWGVPSDSTVFLFFGQLKKTKGLEILLRAFQDVNRMRPSTRLIIAGKNRDFLTPETEDFIAKSPCIILVPRFVVTSEREELFAMGDVVVLPYLESYQSGVAMEALARSRPMIASDVGLFGTLISHGGNGFVVPPGDLASLTKAMQDSVGRAFGITKASVKNEDILDQYEEIYRRLAQAKWHDRSVSGISHEGENNWMQ